MVTLAVLAILLSLAVPSFARMLAANRLTNQTNAFTAALNSGRSEAIRRGGDVTLRAASATNPNDFHRGYVLFVDLNQNGIHETGTEPELQAVAALSGTTTVTRVARNGAVPNVTYAPATGSVASRQYVTYNSRGGITAGGSAFFRVCDSGMPDLPGRIVQISVVGRVSIDNTAADCS